MKNRLEEMLEWHYNSIKEETKKMKKPVMIWFKKDSKEELFYRILEEKDATPSIIDGIEKLSDAKLFTMQRLRGKNEN